jgi:UDP-N-acetyl-D-glucosamine dehydrogenase
MSDSDSSCILPMRVVDSIGDFGLAGNDLSPDFLSDFISKMESKEAVIGVVGLGYVGLPLILRYASVGYKVVGFDIDAVKIDLIGLGKSYIGHIPSEAIVIANSNGMEVTTDFSRASEPDALIICVPTPLNTYREPDLSFVLHTTEELVKNMRCGQLLSLESTTYPGTTDEELKPRLEAQGFIVGEDVFLTFSPEREDPGNPKFQTHNIPKICGGSTPRCLEAGVALYSAAVDRVVPMSSTRAAEMTKLLENIHRAVNIGLVNEMKIVADRMSIDIHEVIRAAATKPFGFTAYYPGPGIGGHCIPIDPFYLTWKAREYGLHTRFIELAGEINSEMPSWVIGKVTDALNQRSHSIMGSKILVLGIAYKNNVDDMRESPAVVLMEILREKGALVSYSDPHVPMFPIMREHHFDLMSVELTEDELKSYDLILLATSHSAFDYDLIQKHAKLVVDTRGVYSNSYSNVIHA